MTLKRSRLDLNEAFLSNTLSGEQMDTTLLRIGLIVDGLGGRAFRGHVLLRGDRIDAILREEDSTP